LSPLIEKELDNVRRVLWTYAPLHEKKEKKERKSNTKKASLTRFFD